MTSGHMTWQAQFVHPGEGNNKRSFEGIKNSRVGFATRARVVSHSLREVEVETFTYKIYGHAGGSIAAKDKKALLSLR